MFPLKARYLSKMLMRQPTLDKLVTRKNEDVDYFVSYIMQPSVQQPIGGYLQALKKKSKINNHELVGWFPPHMTMHFHFSAVPSLNLPVYRLSEQTR